MTTGDAGRADPCPVCNVAGSRVVDSRPSGPRFAWRRRRRRCDGCGHSWRTYEVPGDFLVHWREMLQGLNDARAALDRLDAFMRDAGLPEDDDGADI